MSAREVAFLGPEGTFTSVAVRRLRLLPDPVPVPLATVADVVDAVDTGALPYGVVPFENSIEGVVIPTLDRLVFSARNVLAAEAVVLPVTFTAFVAPAHIGSAGPWRVASHPHALAQCSAYVRRTGETMQTTSTAEACTVAATAAVPTIAVASPEAGVAAGLTAVAEEVEDTPGAATRFLLLSRSVGPAGKPSETLLVVTPASDRTGGLRDLLDVFARRELNLSALVVRPLREALGRYTFVLTVRGHVSDDPVRAAVRELVGSGHAVKLLGSYSEEEAAPRLASPSSVPVGSVAEDGGLEGLLDPPELEYDVPAETGA